MFDIGLSEMLVIGVVALIVVGPKDLPKMFRALGEFTGKARRMAREFQSAMNQAANDTGVGDIAGDLRKVANPKQFGMDKLKDATDEFTNWSPDGDDGVDDRTPEEKQAATKAKIADTAARMADERKAREAAEAAAEAVPDPNAPEPEPASEAKKA